MRLLLAEDEKDLSHALVSIFRHNHYEVDPVYNGLDALAYLESTEYEGVILDIMMPGMDGITLLKKIRANGNTTPVLLLTAKTEVDDRVLGLDSGADDYLGKPFAMQELLARIRVMTRRKEQKVSHQLAYGNLILDQPSCEIRVGEKSCRLSNKEFQMLELLMMYPGQLISTERFMDKIWGIDSEADIQVVWVYISYLRKKLSAVGAKVQIRAFRNQGYRLEEKG